MGVRTQELRATFRYGEFPLEDSVILDSGSNVHVFNNQARFVKFAPEDDGDEIQTGDGKLKIQGYGDAEIRVSTGNRIRKLRLRNAAYVPGLATSVVSVYLLKKDGIWWDMKCNPTVLRSQKGSVLATIEEHYGQYILEYNPIERPKVTHYFRRNKTTSWTKRTPKKGDIIRWHLRLGHPGPGALEHLVHNTEGVSIQGLGIKTHECDACAKGKMERQISRVPRDISENGPGERIAVDFHDFEKDPEGFSSLMLFTDRTSGYSWDFYLQDRSTNSIITAFKWFLGMLELQHRKLVRTVECDNEITTVKPAVARYLQEKFIKIEPSPPHTQALNGAAERSGGAIKQKIIAMRESSKLPISLWREISSAAVYLMNRTPRWRIYWKTPYEVFHSTETRRRYPDLRNLRVYGCKAYAMTTGAMKKEKRKKRFEPRAWIGYLVGYTSSTTYRIWNPLENRVIVTRDVIFNEDETFSGALGDLRDDIKEIDRDELARILNQGVEPVSTSDRMDVDHSNEKEDRSMDLADMSYWDINEPSVDDLPTNSDPYQDLGKGSELPRIPSTVTSEAQMEYFLAEPEEKQDQESGIDAGYLLTPPPSSPETLFLAALTGSVCIPDGGQRSGGPTETPQGVMGVGNVSKRVQPSSPSTEMPDGGSSGLKLTYADAWKAVFYGGTRSSVVETQGSRRITKAMRERRPEVEPETLPPHKKAEKGSKHETLEPREEGNEGTQGVDVQNAVLEPCETGSGGPSKPALGGKGGGTSGNERQKRKVLTREQILGRIQRGENLYRHELPEPPKHHSDLASHPIGDLFVEAEHDHLKSHADRKSWFEVSVQEPRGKGLKVLDCGWVYTYKFDKHGRYVKVKARLVVRGNQQERHIDENNYAATLAGRSFRMMMAIAARFDLELLQYDVVNAFVNAFLDRDIYMRMPPGYRRPGRVLKLKKALYGLRCSPLLWQRTLSEKLKSLSFNQIPQEPCIFVRGTIVIFFYVDDIVVAFRKHQRQEALGVMNQIKASYELSGGEQLQWFLGIEVLRNRRDRKIWLAQTAYIDKVAQLATPIRPAATPMTRDELYKYTGTATEKSIRLYQRKIGSLLYIAVMTRPDIAFAVSKLSRFMTNPGPDHHKAADRVIHYLVQTKDYGLQLGGDDTLVVASDASFADDPSDRKSSQAYAMKLFGGLIGWRANKQTTVTTSTTEAELLALSQAAKEGMFVTRMIKEIGVQLDSWSTLIEVDNKQTYDLITKEISRLATKLKHVDIHNHWLRQEHEAKNIQLKLTPSNELMADGLTKPLQQERFSRFRDMMRVVDVSDKRQRKVDSAKEI